jgi:hypothetical protein
MTFFHMWTTKQGYRVWDKEYKQSGFSDWNLLKPNLYKSESQDVFTTDLKFSDYFYQHIWDTRGHGKAGEWLPYLTLNHLCALESQRRALEMVMHEPEKFDYLMLLRNDALFTEEFPVERLLKAAAKTVYVPDFKHNEGINDRMAFGDVKAMSIYMNRISYAKHYRATVGRIVSEKFLKDVLDQYDIRVEKFPYTFEFKRPM